MVKKIISTMLASSMLLSIVPAVHAEEKNISFGFEDGEQAWTTNSSNGRTAAGTSSEQKHSGEKSYRFKSEVSTSEESEYSSISQSFKADTNSAYKISVWSLLGDDYERLNGTNGGAVFTYTLLDENGTEIPGAGYEYCMAEPKDDTERTWTENDFYILPTDKTENIKITVGLRSTKGTVYYDDITVEKIERTDIK